MQDSFFDPHYIDIVSPVINAVPIGELFLEDKVVQMLSMNHNLIDKNVNNKISGVSIRGVVDDTSYFFSSDNISKKTIQNLTNKLGQYITPTVASSFQGFVTGNTYPNQFKDSSEQKKIELIKEINNYVRQHSLVTNANIIISNSVQKVVIFNNDSNCIYDFRPMVVLCISLVIEKNGKINTVSERFSQRQHFHVIVDNWKSVADEALRKVDIIANATVLKNNGQKKVILGSGGPGILLHEAIGHGLEGDFNQKKTSAFSELFGKPVAKDFITIIDNGTCINERGSINFDDEGTVGQNNILVDQGVLIKYMCDKKTGQELGIGSTGNGRRESYNHLPIPRMTNTYMLPGQSTLEDMLSEMNNGIYVKSVSHGQVKISSGQFSFVCSEAYEVENGRIVNPLLDMSITGVGIEVMSNIQMISGCSKLEKHGGTCGKNGQWAPVGVGQPDVFVSSITCG